MSTTETTNHVTLSSYIAGFALSLYLTITAYLMTTHRLFTQHGLMYALAGIGLIQFVVQLVYFLHLGRDTKPRWKLLVFCFMLMVVCILVFGSLWIMSNLDYHHPMSQTEINTYLHNQDAL